MILKSRRFWMMIAGGILGGAAIIATGFNPESADAIERAATVIIGLLGVGVYSEGTRPMGDREVADKTEEMKD